MTEETSGPQYHPTLVMVTYSTSNRKRKQAS